MVIRIGKKMDFILENPAIGQYDETLAQHCRISALLCVARERDIRVPRLIYHKVPIVDMRPIPANLLKDAVDWIDHVTTLGHHVLVSCNEGIGRSPSVVIAYLCCKRGYAFGRTVETVATIRPRIPILPDLILSIEETRDLA